MMPSLILLVLLNAISVYVSASHEIEEIQLLYSSAFPLHDAEDNGSQPPTNLHIEASSDPSTVVDQQPSSSADPVMRSDEDILVENIVKLIQSISTTSAAEVDDPTRQTSREAKQMNLGATGRLRSLFNIPFNHGQGFIPRTPLGGNIFYGASINNPSGWQQRFINTFSNIFSFGRPNQMLPYGGIGQASTNNPSFAPFPHGGHVSYNPYSHQPPVQNMWNQFQHVPVPQHGEDLSNAASFGHHTRLQLGNTFNPHNYGPVPQQQYQFSHDLQTSGSGMFPHQALAVGNHHQNFGQYVASVPRHKPLFQNVNGLKGASLEMSNAFADFADSHEHGPEVTQKFGSVGHSINTFLGMMGLGSSGGLTSDDVGGFGGGGDYASMDSTPISRSMDFYPGYGNQAVMEDMEDYPIFQEDITKDYLTRMNLTHLLENVSIYEKDESIGNADGEVHVLEISAKDPETGKEMKPKYIVSGMDTKSFYSPPSEKMIYSWIKDSKTQTDSLDAPAQHSDKPKVDETEVGKDAGTPVKDNEQKITSIFSSSITYSIPDGKKPWLLDLKKKPAEDSKKESSEPHEPSESHDKSKGKKETAVSPSVSYKIPPTHSPVAAGDRIPPVAVFQGFPAKSDADAKAPEPPKYAPAHSLPHSHESEENINGLIDDNAVRSWVPVSSGNGYMEKRPKPIYQINSDEIPKGLSIVHQMLSGMSAPDSLQE